MSDLYSAALRDYERQMQMEMLRQQQAMNTAQMYGLGLGAQQQQAGTVLDLQAALLSLGRAFAATSTPALDVPKRQSEVALRGFRAWRLRMDPDGPLLVSLGRECVWPGPVMRADVVPAPGNTNGIYAYHSPQQTSAHRRTDGAPGADVYGELELSGTVLVHALGCRAQRATVRRLVVVPRGGYRARLEELGDRYQCEVVEDPYPWRVL